MIEKMKNNQPATSRRSEMHLAALLCCALAACHKRDALPEEMLVLRSQAAVYKVLAIGDVQVTYPKEVSTRKSADQSEPPWRRRHYRSLVHREFERDRGDGVVESSKNETEYCWEEVTEHPEKYLQASSEQATASWRGPYSSGSAFAVSREGILLTNAHVVSDPRSNELLNPDDINTVMFLLGERIAKMLDALDEEFGGQLPAQWPDYRRRQAIANLARWFAGQSTAKATFRQAQLVLKFDSWGSEEFVQGLRNMKPEELLGIPKQPTTVAAKVLEPKGQRIPGKDVAILKLDRGDPHLTETLKDTLICLPLGDSDQVISGTLIWAMGFPGIAFDAQLMDPEAANRVSSPGGSVGPRKPMLGGWEAFEMDAAINHGDSGGPVIDRFGSVIGLNVALPNGISAGHNLAVPINLAKESLRQAAINPDLGPLTKLWVDGLALYARERYAEAQGKFAQVSRMQERGSSASFSVDNGFARGNTNPYVQEMIFRCREKLRKKTANPS